MSQKYTLERVGYDQEVLNQLSCSLWEASTVFIMVLAIRSEDASYIANS